MTITATYSEYSDFNQDIDLALAAWSDFVKGDFNLKIKISYNDTMSFLATCGDRNTINAGNLNGLPFFVFGPVAKALGINTNPAYDLEITWNRSFPWHHGPGIESGKYTARCTAMHELGHAFFLLDYGSSALTGYQLWKQTHAGQYDTTSAHLNDPNSMFYPSVNMAQDRVFTATDKQVIAACGVPTKANDGRIFLPSGSIVAAGSGYNTGTWLKTFSQYNGQLSNFDILEMLASDALTTTQANIYKLYKAAFVRFPDFGGFSYWVNSGYSLDQIASFFVNSSEFITKFGAAPRDRGQYITKLYQNIYNRAPDSGGYNYWMTRTDLNDAQMLTTFALQPENVINVVTFIPSGI